jgi:hypothetical protein
MISINVNVPNCQCHNPCLYIGSMYKIRGSKLINKHFGLKKLVTNWNNNIVCKGNNLNLKLEHL